MEFNKKFDNYYEKLLSGKGDDIECFMFDKKGNFLLRDKGSYQVVDCVYFCIQSDGKRIKEFRWKKDDGTSTKSKCAIAVKNNKKVIFVDENDRGYGFGYNATHEDQGFVLYIRIRNGARLIWAKSASIKVNTAVEFCENLDDADDLDYLVEFMCDKETDEGEVNVK